MTHLAVPMLGSPIPGNMSIVFVLFCLVISGLLAGGSLGFRLAGGCFPHVIGLASQGQS